MRSIWRDTTFRWLVGCLVACVAFVSVMVANEVGGTYEVVSEPYTATYTYCAAWAGAGGQHHCTAYLTGTERRVNTIVHGYFFETTGYKVVD